MKRKRSNYSEYTNSFNYSDIISSIRHELYTQLRHELYTQLRQELYTQLRQELLQELRQDKETKEVIEYSYYS